MKKMSVTLKLLVVFGLIFLVSCSPVAHVEKDRHTDFSRYKTFAWMENSSDHGRKGRYNSLSEQNIKQAVGEELEKQGWREVKSNPDVLIGYDILVERATRQSNNPVYSQPYTRLYFNPYLRRWGTIYYPSQFLGYDQQAYNSKEGTITISMVDVRTDKTVWQGWTTNEVNSSNLTRKEIQNGVRSIFRKFDVAKN